MAKTQVEDLPIEVQQAILSQLDTQVKQLKGHNIDILTSIDPQILADLHSQGVETIADFCRRGDDDPLVKKYKGDILIEILQGRYKI